MNNQVKYKESKLLNFFSKPLIVFFYILIIAFFLYLPKISTLLFVPTKTINVYAFTDMISQKTVNEFEKQTGISVRMKYFDTNEELLAKFKIDKGYGYDLITTSDYAIELLIKEDLLQKIDHSEIPNAKQIDNRLLNHAFDRENRYSLPYFWSVDGIVYKKNAIKNSVHEITWDIIFKNPNQFLKQNDTQTNYKICMLDNAQEILFLAAIYLFGKTQNLTNNDLLQIKKLLLKQKEWVEIYMLASLQYYLLSDVVPIAVSSSAFAKKILEVSDKFDFVVPKKGSVLLIENLAIPKTSLKANFAHKFINFVLSKENMLNNSKIYGYNPSNKESYAGIDKKILNNPSFFPDDEMFKRLHLTHNQIDARKIENLWFEVRVS